MSEFCETIRHCTLSWGHTGPCSTDTDVTASRATIARLEGEGAALRADNERLGGVALALSADLATAHRELARLRKLMERIAIDRLCSCNDNLHDPGESGAGQ